MYQVTEEYKELVYQEDVPHILNVYLGESLQKMNADIILGLKITHKLLTSDEFAFGKTPSRMIELQLHKSNLPDDFNNIYIETGINEEVVPIGYFTLESVQEDDDTITIKAIDNMVKFEVNYDGSTLEYPCNLMTVLTDICNKVGVELGSTSFLNQNAEIAVYDNAVSARTYLSYIAEQAGGFAFIGRDGKLYIKTIGEDIAELPIQYFQDFKWGEQFKVSRVRYEDGVQLFEKGNETNNTIYINQENMYIVDQEQIDNIYNAYKEFNCYSFEGNSIIDPALDIGDLLLIDGKYVIYQGDMDYVGKFKANISSKIQAKTKEETMVRTPSQKAVNRRVQSQINQAEGKIGLLIEETNELQTQVTDITTTQATKEGTEIKIDDAAEEPIIKLEVDGKSNQATRSGKNILDLSNVTTITSNGITLTNNGDGTVTLNGTATDVAYLNFVERIEVKVDEVYSIGIKNANENIAFSFREETSGSNMISTTGYNNSEMINVASKVGGKCFSYLSVKSGATLNNVTIFPMIVKANTLGEYEQYGAMPSPEFPSEIQSVGDDVNLFDVSTAQLNKALAWTSGNYFNNTGSVASDFIEVENGKTYVSKYKIQIILFDENKNYIKQYGNNNAYNTFTIDENNYAKYVKICFYSVQNTNIDFTQANDLKLQQGTEATAYSEYGKGTVEIKQGGNNLAYDGWAEDFVKRANNSSQAKIETKDNRRCLTYVCSVGYNDYDNKYLFKTKWKENTQYTIQFDINVTVDKCPNFSIEYTDNTRSLLNLNITAGTWQQCTITTDINKTVKYIRANYQNGYTSIDLDTFIIKEGTVITEYEEYKANNYLIPTTPLRSLPNGVKDTIEEDGIHRRVGSIVLDGSENWNNYTTSSDGRYYCSKHFGQSSNFENPNKFICTHFTSSNLLNLVNSISGTQYATYINMDTDIASNLTEFKTWLSTHNTELFYELAEEVIEPFDEEQQEVIDRIKTMLGTQYFTCDANMRITYVRNNGLSDMYETKQNAIKKYAQQEMRLTETGALIESLVSVTNALNDGFKVGDEALQKQLETLGEELQNYQLTTSTSFEQTEKNFQMKFNELIESINANAEGNSEKFAEIVKYIRFEDGNIVLGRSDNQLILKIQNDRISYQQNGSEVAYFSNNKLYVTTLEVTHSLQLGNFAFIPRANGNLSFKKVGGN